MQSHHSLNKGGGGLFRLVGDAKKLNVGIFVRQFRQMRNARSARRTPSGPHLRANEIPSSEKKSFFLFFFLFLLTSTTTACLPLQAARSTGSFAKQRQKESGKKQKKSEKAESRSARNLSLRIGRSMPQRFAHRPDVPPLISAKFRVSKRIGLPTRTMRLQSRPVNGNAS